MNENLKPFNKGYDERRNVNGRPKKIFNLIKESGYSKEDIRDAFDEIGWQTMDDLNEVMLDPNKPVILKVIAKAFLRGADKGDFRYVSEILTHVLGKPKEQVDVTTQGDKINQFDISLKL